MQDTRLSNRFLADWPAAFTPEAELVYEGPRRQKELIAIGRQQLELQRSAAEAIRGSNIDAANIIANEINQQTVALERSLCSFANQVSSSVMDAADQISASIDSLKYALCVSLDEIKWQIAQIGTTTAAILHVLRENRSNEARQLVEQGVRHYINEQYSRAEERFMQALIQDTTDYQVLMNLGLIAVEKGDSLEACEFFLDALRLPSRLDNPSKNRALLMIARLHYANRKYDDALQIARKAAAVADAGQVEDIFILGTYAALAGDVGECLNQLETAILKRPALFAKAAVDPDLEPCRPHVMDLLSRLVLDLRESIIKEVSNAREMISKVNMHDASMAVNLEASMAAAALDQISQAILDSSYCDLLTLQMNAEKVKKAINLISGAVDAAVNQNAAECQIPALKARADTLEAELQQLIQIPSFRIEWWFLWHIGSLIVGSMVGLALFDSETEVGSIVGLWFWVGMPVWLLLQHVSNKIADSKEAAYAMTRLSKLQAASLARSNSISAVTEARKFGQRRETLLKESRSLLRLPSRRKRPPQSRTFGGRESKA